jgi:hypothetical protein
VFPDGWSDAAAAFLPAALAATREQLLKLASADPPVLTHALIVVHAPGGALLSAAERERLWRAFRVPAFEQMIGERGELLAAECEAHDGLHIELPGRDWSRYLIEPAACACGRKTPRLSHTEALERTRAAAVYAR